MILRRSIKNELFTQSFVIDPVLWLLSADGVDGASNRVDTWETRSTSGVTLTESGAGKPYVVGPRVRMDNAAVQQNYFLGGDTSTFQAITETGVFVFAWRGTIDAYDSPFFTVDCSLFHTRGSSGRGANLFVHSGGTALSFVTWNGGNVITHRCDYASFDVDYTLGDDFDVAIKGDGVNMRMYLNGFEVGTTGTISTDAGAHASVANFGKLNNGALYHIGSIEGVFFDDTDDYELEALRSYVTVDKSVPNPLNFNTIQHRWVTTDGLFSDLGGTTVAAPGDPVGVWKDSINGIELVAPSTAARPALESVGGTQVVSFDGTDDAITTIDDALTIEDAPWTAFFVLKKRASGYVVYSSGTSATDVIRIQEVDANTTQVYTRNTATNAAIDTRLDDWYAMVVTRDLGGVMSIYINGLFVASATHDVSFAGIKDLRLGSRNDGVVAWDGSASEVAVYGRILTIDEIEALQEYAFGTYGADLGLPDVLEEADPRNILSLVGYLDARELGATLSDGDPVVEWPSSRGAVDGTQGVVAAQPLWRAASIGTGPAVDFDGADDRIRWDVESGGTSYTLSWLLSADDFDVTGSLFDATAGRVFIRVNASTGAVVVFTNGTQVTTAAALTAATGCLLTIRFRAADSECDVWIDGTEVVQGATYNPVVIDGATRLASSNTGGSTYFDGKLGAALIFNDALTDLEIEGLWAYFQDKWGL